ncbi:MAG: B12-binding domain-containing radical SAM protein [Lachnospiraceae bacterium]|nr:B12-binding domain-containing radical SAM protein [Lachnospiraceae bacterium]
MKLLMLHAWNENENSYRGKFSSLLSYPSLTLATLYSLIPEGVFEQIDVVDENSQIVQYDKEHYDLVMISFETSSSFTAYKHCKEFKARGAYVVCGGYHATALPDEVAEHCDTVIIGPAEISIPQFIKDFKEGKPEKRYKNYDVCAAEFPIPARDKITKRKKLKIPAIVANRGCDNCCKYCSMRTMWNSNPRPVENVIAELKELKSKMVIFYDPNFFGNREYALELMEAMKPLKILWASNATADFGYDHELMQAAYESGCRGVLIGLESVNSQSLTKAAKRFHDADKYVEIIDNLHQHGIAVNGCFVLGFDQDIEEELLSLPDRVTNLGLDLCRFAILTPYPGTRFYQEYEAAGRIITHDWSRYNQHHTVFQPVNMSPERLDEIYRKVWKEAFSWKRVLKRTFSSPWRKNFYVFILLGANIGFKFLGIDKGYKH